MKGELEARLIVLAFTARACAGPLRKFRGISVVDLERAMARDAGRDDPGVHVYHWAEFSALVRAER
ncbi:hypothetical protein [Nannocystis pusilla]|uniref:Uncharacterized protein n=1 Tax=Nannocystis pusilla TaxID=889268 RepID=A0ABS7U447_9BACT|nr:hypothetical protein [Nannocystis pusilla]MBZ5715051.1 hypothetical protein [Nannocystis pusilla]